MADNVGYTEGSGKIIATDDVGGVHFQKMKLDLGGDGLSLPVTGYVLSDDVNANATVLPTAAAVQLYDPSTDKLVRWRTANVLLDGVAGGSFPPVGMAAHTGSNWYRVRGDTTNGLDVDVTQIQSISGIISTQNSSTSTLTATSVFTGTGVDVSRMAAVTISSFANVASSGEGFQVQWSSDNSNWDLIETFTAPSGVGIYYSSAPKARYVRVVYRNGATNQSSFRLETKLHLVNIHTQDIEHTHGRLSLNGLSAGVKWQAINATAGGDTTIVAGVPERKIRIVAIMFTCAGNVDISFKSGSASTIINTMSFAKSGGPAVNFMPAGYFCETATGQPFVMNLSAAVNVRGMINYLEVP
jgi:hypothetical protein